MKTTHGIIAIVDDTTENLRLLTGILTKQGYDVRPFPNGSLFLGSLEILVPDLILLDIRMAGLDGYAVCQHVKADDRTRDIPVIFISALQDVADKIKGFAVGGVDYITKPIQPEEVITRVQTHITLRKMQQRLQENNRQLRQEIAERQRAEQELKTYQEHLEELVTQRTRELQESNAQLQGKNAELQRSQESLKQAKVAIETANRVKNEFIANISHEVRTPLNGILGYVHILENKTVLTERQQSALKIIQQSSEHLLVIINDILDLALLEANRMRLVAELLHLPTFLHRLTSMIEIQAHLQNVVFHEEIAANLPTFIKADEKRLRQILLNLLGNAVKFTRQGAVIFRVGNVETTYSHARRIRFEIEDTGIGIPPEQLTTIFEAFHQTGNKFLAETEGIGLGLTVSQRLASMMGSELHVRSVFGKGSTFWFELDVPETQHAVQSDVMPSDLSCCCDAATPATPMILPPKEIITALYKSVRIGDIMNVREQLSQLAAREPEFSAFTGKLGKLAQELQLKELQRNLERYLTDET